MKLRYDFADIGELERYQEDLLGRYEGFPETVMFEGNEIPLVDALRHDQAGPHLAKYFADHDPGAAAILDEFLLLEAVRDHMEEHGLGPSTQQSGHQNKPIDSVEAAEDSEYPQGVQRWLEDRGLNPDNITVDDLTRMKAINPDAELTRAFEKHLLDSGKLPPGAGAEAERPVSPPKVPGLDI